MINCPSRWYYVSNLYSFLMCAASLPRGLRQLMRAHFWGSLLADTRISGTNCFKLFRLSHSTFKIVRVQDIITKKQISQKWRKTKTNIKSWKKTVINYIYLYALWWHVIIHLLALQEFPVQWNRTAISDYQRQSIRANFAIQFN